MASIVVVGSLNMDLVARTPRLPASGETILGKSFATIPGGKGANQAVAAAKLGASVNMVGRTGKDDFGHALRSNLNAVGVDTRLVAEDSNNPTGVALIQVDDAGQNTIIVVPGANGQVARADVDAANAVIRQARVLVAQLEIPPSTVQYALVQARAAGVITLLNPAPAQPLSRDMLQLADVVIPNETEAALLTGITVNDLASAQNAASALRQMGARRIIITLGAQGALWMDENAVVQKLVPYEVKAVDTTAAGDAFVGALAAGLAHDKDWLTALGEASAAGALSATKPGAQPSLPTRAELDSFLSNTI